MAKFTLDIEYEYQFSLIGISCHARDYKLCWSINNQLEYDFSRKENLKLVTKVSSQEFSHYSYEDLDEHHSLSLISNKEPGYMLIPEQKQADYFLKVTGMSDAQIEELIKKLRSVDVVITAFLIDIEKLKSKQNLLIE
jgi:hypothetical protein